MSTAPLAGSETIAPLPQNRFDVEALTEHMRAHVPGFRGPISVRQFAGGLSNPTFLLESPSGQYVMRKKPGGVLLPSAHAVEREFRIISALAGSAVPVPEAYCLCEDPAVLGQTFYVMAYVPGRVFRDPAMPGVSAEQRAALYRAAAEQMGRMHRVDFRAVGLGDMARPGNYFARQITRWYAQYEASQTEDIAAMPKLREWLLARVPPEGPQAIVHNDFRLENILFHPSEARVVAVLDWELCTIGDPVADLALNLVPFFAPVGITFGFRSEAERHTPGIPSVEAHVADYCRAAGLERTPNVGYCAVYGLFRQSCALQGIYGRAIKGTASSDVAARLGPHPALMAQAGWALTQQAG